MLVFIFLILTSCCHFLRASESNSSRPNIEERIRLAFENDDLEGARSKLLEALRLPISVLPFIRSKAQLSLVKTRFPDTFSEYINLKRKETGRNAFLNCCQYGGYDGALDLLENYEADPNSQDSEGHTALMIISLDPRLDSAGYEILKTLLLQISDISAQNNNGQNILDLTILSPEELSVALAGAVERDDTVSLGLLLASVEDFPLDFVQQIKSIEMLKTVERLAGDRLSDAMNLLHPSTKMTLLHKSISRKDFQLVDYLLKRHNVSALVKEGKSNRSALTHALYILSIVPTVSFYGVMNKIIMTIVEHLGDALTTVARTEQLRQLLRLCGFRLTPVVKRMIENYIDPDDITLMRMRVEATCDRSMERGLVRSGLDLDNVTTMTKEEMFQVLLRTLDNNLYKEVQFLLSYDAPVHHGLYAHIQDHTMTNVFIAKFGMQQYIWMASKVNPATGMSDLHEAVWAGNFLAIQRLVLKALAAVDVLDKHGQTSLMIALKAAEEKRPGPWNEIVQFLAPFSSVTLQGPDGKNVLEMLEKRSVYKKLSIETLRIVADREWKHPIDPAAMLNFEKIHNERMK